MEPDAPLPYSQKPATLSPSRTRRIQRTLPHLISLRCIFALPSRLGPSRSSDRSHMPLYTFKTKMIRGRFGILTKVIIRLAVTCGLVETHTQHKVCGATYRNKVDNVERRRTSNTITFCVITLVYNFNVRCFGLILNAIVKLLCERH